MQKASEGSRRRSRSIDFVRMPLMTPPTGDRPAWRLRLCSARKQRGNRRIRPRTVSLNRYSSLSALRVAIPTDAQMPVATHRLAAGRNSLTGYLRARPCHRAAHAASPGPERHVPQLQRLTLGNNPHVQPQPIQNFQQPVWGHGFSVLQPGKRIGRNNRESSRVVDPAPGCTRGRCARPFPDPPEPGLEDRSEYLLEQDVAP